jgi:hypothetical protein
MSQVADKSGLYDALHKATEKLDDAADTKKQ